jgi:chaperone modulatory protein CbpM
MQTENLIAIQAFCDSHNIEVSFISSVQQMGLIEIVEVEEVAFVEVHHLPFLEKIVRFHFDLDINLQGIEAIVHLLQRMNKKEEEIKALRNQLRLYEIPITD